MSTEPENAAPPAAVEVEKAAPPATVEVKKATPPAAVEVEKAAPVASHEPRDYLSVADAALRLLLFASAVVAVVVMVSSKQTEMVPVPFPPFQAPLSAKFTQSPSFIYFVAALSVAGLYSIISTLASFYNLIKPGFCPILISHFIVLDVVMLGIVASATGTAGAVAYVGLKGNSHVGWGKICDMYDKFCRHLGSSIAVSLFASILLLVLIILSIRSLSKKIPK